MADRKPLKVVPDSASGTGGGDSTGIGEFLEADTLGVVDGGTGLATVATDNILTGNGTSALSAESNLTFDGSTLAITGSMTLSSTSTISGDMTFVDNAKVTLGTGGDSDIYYDGSHLIVNPKVAGTGMLKVVNGGNVAMEIQGTTASTFLQIAADSEAQNNGTFVIFQAAKDTDAGSANTTAYLQSVTTNSGGALTGDLRFFTNGGDSIAERMRILSSGGLTFNGDTATANALDDYEEGTFSPGMKYTPSGGSATAYTIGSGSYGAYVKIGQFVWFNMQIHISNAEASNAADAPISFTGLPYASNADNPGAGQYSYSTPLMRAWSFNEANATITPYVRPNSTIVDGFVYYNNGTNWASLMSDQIYVSAGNNFFQISGSYRAA